MDSSSDRSGQCVFARRPLFRLERCPPGFAESSRFGFRNVALFSAPPEVVFDTIADGDRESEWFPSFRRLEWLTGTRLVWQVGYEPGFLFRPVHGLLHRHFAADFRKAVEALGQMLGLEAPIETQNRGPQGKWSPDPTEANAARTE
ncbi:MAG: SRPBCC family protein [Deltaproteobacteria bacterium]|nr:SRPBCC family protein [Deltaproteobacteria bacterium]